MNTWVGRDSLFHALDWIRSILCSVIDFNASKCLSCLAACWATSVAGGAAESQWSLIQVPGAWETTGPGEARQYDGFAWYRTWLKPHDSFFTKHERDLFAESVTFNIRDLGDAYEVFVNGTSIG